MNRDEIIARLRAVEPALRKRGVGGLFLFGSQARGDAMTDSDVDLFVDPIDERFYELETYMSAYREISEALGEVEVGYATRSGLSPYIREEAVKQAIRIF